MSRPPSRRVSVPSEELRQPSAAGSGSAGGFAGRGPGSGAGPAPASAAYSGSAGKEPSSARVKRLVSDARPRPSGAGTPR